MISVQEQVIQVEQHEKRLLRPANKRSSDRADKMIKRPPAISDTAIISDVSIFVVFLGHDRMWFWKLCDQEFDVKILQPTLKDGSYTVFIWASVPSNGNSEMVVCEGNNINSDKCVRYAESIPPNILKW